MVERGPAFASANVGSGHRRRWSTREDARDAIGEDIEIFDNRIRRHSAIGGISRAAFSERARANEDWAAYPRCLPSGSGHGLNGLSCALRRPRSQRLEPRTGGRAGLLCGRVLWTWANHRPRKRQPSQYVCSVGNGGARFTICLRAVNWLSHPCADGVRPISVISLEATMRSLIGRSTASSCGRPSLSGDSGGFRPQPED
jgi:hypothetical protein